MFIKIYKYLIEIYHSNARTLCELHVANDVVELWLSNARILE